MADLALDSDTQFAKIGIRFGERVVDLACGPGGVLHLLGKWSRTLIWRRPWPILERSTIALLPTVPSVDPNGWHVLQFQQETRREPV
jgi:hypothetical protein